MRRLRDLLKTHQVIWENLAYSGYYHKIPMKDLDVEEAGRATPHPPAVLPWNATAILA
jgi:hypothetical protein